jgi:hypothetical protein
MRNLSIDYLKVALALSVVLLHLNFLRNEFPELGFTLVNGLFRLAVPLFLIITGYYFTQITTFEKFKKWLLRITILYVIWMVFYAPIWINSDNLIGTLLTIPIGYFVLWYLAGVIVGGSLLFFCRNIESKYLLSLAISLYLIGYFLQQIGNLHLFTGGLDKLLNWYPISRNFLFDCFPLLALGLLIKRTKLDLKLKISITLLILSIILVILESYLNYKFISSSESLDHLLTILITAPIIFIYVKNIKIMGDNKNLAFFSTAIFLIHPFFITLHSFFSIEISKVFFVLGASLIASIFLVLLNKKFKYLL